MPKQVTYACTEHVRVEDSTSLPRKCPFQCTNMLHLKKHMVTDHDIREPPSSRPSRANPPFPDLTQSLTMPHLMHPPREHQCASCPESYTIFKDLDQHMRKIHGIFVCRYKPHPDEISTFVPCKFVGHTKKENTEHQKIHCLPKTVPCLVPDCGAMCLNPTTLGQHHQRYHASVGVLQ